MRPRRLVFLRVPGTISVGRGLGCKVAVADSGRGEGALLVRRALTSRNVGTDAVWAFAEGGEGWRPMAVEMATRGSCLRDLVIDSAEEARIFISSLRLNDLELDVGVLDARGRWKLIGDVMLACEGVPALSQVGDVPRRRRGVGM